MNSAAVVLYGALLAGAMAGCAASGGMQVSRVSRVDAPRDTTRWRDAPVSPQPDPATTYSAMLPVHRAPPAGTAQPAKKSARQGETPATRAAAPAVAVVPSAAADDTSRVPAVLSVERAEAPPLSTGPDPFDTMFTGAGRVVDLGDAPIEPATGPAPAVTPPPRTGGESPVTEAPAVPPAQRTPLVAPRGGTPAAQSPPAATRPAGVERAPASRGFAVQLHAFPTRPAADFAARQAGRSLGVATRVRTVSDSSLPYKVIAGSFATRAAALELRERALREGYPEAWVVPDPSPDNR